VFVSVHKQDVLSNCPPSEAKTEACGPDQQPLTIIPVPGGCQLKHSLVHVRAY